MVALDKQLKGQGKMGLKIILVPDTLEDEDRMEMLDAGRLQAMRAHEKVKGSESN